MTLLVEHKCEQAIPSIYQFKHKYIKQVMKMNNKSMQEINTSKRYRESNRKHGRIISRFEHPCSTSPTSTLWKTFTINWSYWITRCRNTYNEFTLELLGLTSPSLIPARTTHASTLAYRGRISTPRSHKNSKQYEPASSPSQIQWWNTWWSKHFDHLKSLSQQLSY